MKGAGDVDSIVFSMGVKQHLFEPSGRIIWTVVGKENEHWLDPDLGVCSCEDFYYNVLSKGGECYHLRAQREANKLGKTETIKFLDSEFESFVLALVQDIL